MVNCCSRVRTWVGILIFVGCCVSYSLRVNVSVVVLQITSFANNTHEDKGDCRTVMFRIAKSEPLLVATLLSVYDLGHSISFLLYKVLETKVGPTAIIGWSTMVAAFLTILNPFAYENSAALLIALRFFIGLMGGFLPLVNILITDWSPSKERNIFGMALFGCTVGVITTYPLSGWIAKTLNWKWITHITGITAFMWSILWLIFMRDLPADHKWVTNEELFEITGNRISIDYRHRATNVPWKKIIKCVPFRALVVLMWTNTWNMCFYLNYMPLYFRRLLGFELFTATAIATLPFIIKLLFSLMCIPAVRYFLIKRLLSVGKTRKAFTFVSHILPGVIELTMLYWVCDRYIGTVKTVLVLGLNGAVVGGGMVNIADLMPHFAGSVYGKMQSLLCLSGACMSFVFGFVLMQFNSRPIAWMILLAINGCNYLLGGMVFLKYGSGSLQEWDVVTVRRTTLHGLTMDAESEDSFGSR